MINSYEEIIKHITRLILTNQQKMIREDDLKNIYDSSLGLDFNKIMSDVYGQLKKIGFELIKTEFLDQKFYVLISEGKDDNITPSQYGTLALILALSKEVDENMKISDLEEMFSEVWNTDIEFLINNDYLRKIEDLGIMKVTPIAKATFFNLLPDLKLKNLLEVFENKVD